MELSFSNDFFGVMVAMMFACIILPVMYYVFYAFKRKINHAAVLVGIGGFVIFAFMLSGMLLGVFAKRPEDGVIENPMLFAAIRALCVSVAETGGMFIMLKLISGRYGDIKTPISFGLGYSLINMIIAGGANTVMRLSQALSVNSVGLQSVLETVDASKRDALLSEITAIYETPPLKYLLTAGEYVCFFFICIGVSRLLWYSIKGGLRKPSLIFLPLALVLRFFADFPVAFYQAGGSSDYIMTECIHYGVSVLILALSITAAWFWDEKEQVRADLVNRRLL